jgi:hypothetical protein
MQWARQVHMAERTRIATKQGLVRFAVGSAGLNKDIQMQLKQSEASINRV